jgi:hypothetical protein
MKKCIKVLILLNFIILASCAQHNEGDSQEVTGAKVAQNHIVGSAATTMTMGLSENVDKAIRTKVLGKRY